MPPSPTLVPTNTPTISPTAAPTTFTGDDTERPKPKASYRPGVLTVQENGLVLSEGLKSRILARTGQFVSYKDGTNSSIPFHILPDGAATFSIEQGQYKGGWIYVSNSEGKTEGSGGVGALTFDKNGNVVGYKNLLNGTTMNCSGGKTPWNTWVVSC